MLLALGAASSVSDLFKPLTSSAQAASFNLIPSRRAETQIPGSPNSGSGAPAQGLSPGTMQILVAAQADDNNAVGQLMILKNVSSATTANSDGSITTSITFDDGP